MRLQPVAAALMLTLGSAYASTGPDPRAAALQRVAATQTKAGASASAAAGHRAATPVPPEQGAAGDEYREFSRWLREAREGHAEAQYQVGLMYLNGEGVTASDTRALDWLWKAADRGSTKARDLLEYVLNNDFTYGC